MRSKLLKKSKLEQGTVPATDLKEGDMIFGRGPVFTVVRVRTELDEVAVVGQGVALRLEPEDRVEILRRVYSSKTADAHSDKAKEYPDADAFLKNHQTGYIQPEAYDRIDFNWPKYDKYPVLLKTITLNDGTPIEFRQSGEALGYTKHDENGEIVRDEHGIALSMTPEEIKAAGLRLVEPTIMLFDKEHKCAGYASDEWGADGVFIRPDMRNKGLGTELLTEFRKQFKPERRMGQMTPAGMALTKKYYNNLLLTKNNNSS